jgi:hypothetical protein
MKPAPTPRLWLYVLLLAASVGLQAALTTGGIAYTKRLKTKLLAEPKPMAEATGEVGFNKELKISTVQGAWLQVSSDSASGWVFNGNVSATKPEIVIGADGVPLAATTTTASAAARPLTPAANDYAKANGMTNARDDLNWLVETSAGVTDDDVRAYMQEHKRGEYK